MLSALLHACFWFLMLMPMGLLLPYLALYLGEVAGLSNLEIGAVFAVFPLVGLLAQPAWGMIADRSGQRTWVLAVLNLGGALAYLLLWRSHGFGEILAATAFAAFFVRAMMAVAMSVTLPALGDRPAVFGRVRACGTVGFLAAVLAFPPLAALFPRPGDEGGLHFMFPVSAAFSLLAGMAALALPRSATAIARAAAGEWRTLLRNGAFLRLLALGFFAFVFLNGPMEFFPRLVADRGGDASVVSHLWLIMLLPEIGLLLGFRQADRLGARRLLALGIAAGGLRWTLTGALTSMPGLFVAQSLHAVVVIGLMLGAPLYIHRSVPAHLQSTAQGLHGAAALGIGGALSSVAAGWLSDGVGVSAPFWAGGIGALLLAVALPRLLPPEPSIVDTGNTTESAPTPTGSSGARMESS